MHRRLQRVGKWTSLSRKLRISVGISRRLPMQAVSDSAELFRHVSAEKAYFYRCIMNVFAAAKRQYRLQLRPDEVLAEARWPAKLPEIEEVNAALTQLTAWGNLERILTLRGCPVLVISTVLAISIGSRKAVKP